MGKKGKLTEPRQPRLEEGKVSLQPKGEQRPVFHIDKPREHFLVGTGAGLFANRSRVERIRAAIRGFKDLAPAAGQQPTSRGKGRKK